MKRNAEIYLKGELVTSFDFDYMLESDNGKILFYQKNDNNHTLIGSVPSDHLVLTISIE